jgi:hypothetical protein
MTRRNLLRPHWFVSVCLAFILVLWVPVASSTQSQNAEPRLALYVPFDGHLDAEVALGNPEGRFMGRASQLQYVKGISGQGLLSGEIGQAVRFDAKENLPLDAWTITFWLKGLPGADWANSIVKDEHLHFWTLTAPGGGSTQFYKYGSRIRLMLWTRPSAQERQYWLELPDHEEEEWHFWATTWKSGEGVRMYLDGQLVAQDRAYEPVKNSTQLIIGQRSGQDRAEMIIDEFKIYEGVLPAEQLQRLFWQEGNQIVQPKAAVGPSSQPIKIDGRSDFGEWQEATRIGGFVGCKQWDSPRVSSSVWLTYDERNLYLKMHSELPSEVTQTPDIGLLRGLLKQEVSERVGPVEQDDSFVVGIRPNGALGDTYVLAVNGREVIHDYRIKADGALDHSWNPPVQIGSSIGMDGWMVEAAIPLTAFGLNAIENGTTWQMNFARVWKLLQERIDVWAPIRSGLEMGLVSFAPQPIIVQLNALSYSDNGLVDSRLEVFNPRSTSQSLTATIAAGERVAMKRTISLEPGERQSIEWSGDLSDAGGQLLAVGVAEQDGSMPFFAAMPLLIRQGAELTVWSYPSIEKLRLGWFFPAGTFPSASLSLCAVISSVTGEEVKRHELKMLPDKHGSTLIDLAGVFPGEYLLDVEILGPTGLVQHETRPLTLKPRPEWLGNTLGLSASPPPPWTDVAVSKQADSVEVWGRKTCYFGALLPVQLINQGQPMLAGPIDLTLKMVGNQSFNSAKAPADRAEWTAITAVRADTERSQMLGSVLVQSNSYTDFDGMTWIDLQVIPVDNKPVAIESLTLTIPLRPEWAQLINPDNYRLTETGLLSAEGWQGTNNAVWVGNGDGGFQFFTESTQDWVGSKQIEVKPNGGSGSVEMRIRLVDQPMQLTERQVYSFGWIASPVKPAPSDHRDWRLFSGDLNGVQLGTGKFGAYLRAANAVNPDLVSYNLWSQGWWWTPLPYKGNYDLTGFLPVAAKALFQPGKINTIYGAKVFNAPYGRMQQIGTANPWFEQFGDEWQPGFDQVFQPDATLPLVQQKTEVSQAAPSLRDFFAWGYDQFIRNYDIKALYFDVSRPMQTNNFYSEFNSELYSELGVRPTTDSPASIYNIRGTRETYRRIYTLLKENDPEAKMFCHLSGQALLPLCSFCDGVVDGENYTALLNRTNQRGYEGILSLDKFRAQFNAQNALGPVTIVLPQFSRSGAVLDHEWAKLGYGHAEYLLGLILLHDSNIWWAYYPLDVLQQVYLQLDKLGWGADWNFIPYWRQSYFKLPAGVVASIYLSPERTKAVLVVMNTSNRDVTVDLPLTGNLPLTGDLPLRWSAFTDVPQVSALYPNLPVELNNGKVCSLKVQANNFRAIVVH